jgi:hypothetical protein
MKGMVHFVEKELTEETEIFEEKPALVHFVHQKSHTNLSGNELRPAQ